MRVIAVAQLLILSIGLTPFSVLPVLLRDIIGEANKWGDSGKSGRIDPFTEVYNVSHFVLRDAL